MKTIIEIRKNLANAITMANMALGILSVIFTTYGELNTAIYMILIAAILDRMDGMIARHLNTTSELGLQLDSLSDLISFGIAPALMAFYFEFYHFQGKLWFLGIVVTLFFVLCGGFRLARYNCNGIVDGNFTGIPITICGMFLVATMLFTKRWPAGVYMGLMILLGFLMVSKVQFKKR